MYAEPFTPLPLPRVANHLGIAQDDRSYVYTLYIRTLYVLYRYRMTCFVRPEIHTAELFLLYHPISRAAEISTKQRSKDKPWSMGQSAGRLIHLYRSASVRMILEKIGQDARRFDSPKGYLQAGFERGYLI